MNSSLAGAEKYENLEKEWRFLQSVVNESFDLALGRIDDSWYGLIDSSDTVKLPWEEGLSLAILLEQCHAILEEYKVLEAVFKAGTKEILNTLQSYLIDGTMSTSFFLIFLTIFASNLLYCYSAVSVFEKLEDTMFYDPQDAKRASKGMSIIRRMEKSIDKVNP